jgi:hypothetical protein
VPRTVTTIDSPTGRSCVISQRNKGPSLSRGSAANPIVLTDTVPASVAAVALTGTDRSHGRRVGDHGRPRLHVGAHGAADGDDDRLSDRQVVRDLPSLSRGSAANPIVLTDTVPASVAAVALTGTAPAGCALTGQTVPSPTTRWGSPR